LVEGFVVIHNAFARGKNMRKEKTRQITRATRTGAIPYPIMRHLKKKRGKGRAKKKKKKRHGSSKRTASSGSAESKKSRGRKLSSQFLRS